MQHFSCETVADLAVPGLSGGRLTVLALHGAADAAARGRLASALAAAGPVQLVVDLSGLRLLSRAGAEVLYGVVAEGAAQGRLLRLAGCPPQIAAVLARTRAGRAPPEQYSSVTDALAAVIAAAVAAPEPDCVPRHPRTDTLELRHALLGRAVTARAQGMLRERYGIGVGDARTLLTAVARVHGVTAVQLSSALGHAPPLRPGEPWSPGHGRAAPPVVRFVTAARDRSPVLSVFLDALRDAVCGITQTDMASVQLIDANGHTLRLASHCGVSAAFVRFFAVTDGITGTVCGQAAGGERVVVDDVATAPDFDEPARAAILAVPSRSVQCTPIPGRADRPQGMLCTHHTQPGHTYTAAELTALDTVAAEAGRWLDWYRTNTLQDALEDLHRRAPKL
jgi:anti-anti-sigma regulatory factor